MSFQIIFKFKFTSNVFAFVLLKVDICSRLQQQFLCTDLQYPDEISTVLAEAGVKLGYKLGFMESEDPQGNDVRPSTTAEDSLLTVQACQISIFGFLMAYGWN